VIEHAAKITAINPSAAGLAPDEMLRLVLVAISTLCNVFAAGNPHSSLFSLCRPQCVSLRDELNSRWTGRLSALSMPMRACISKPRPSAARAREAVTLLNGGLLGSSAYLAIVPTRGWLVFRHEGVRFGWLHRRRGRDQRADRSTRTTLSEALSVDIGFGSLIDRSIRVTSA
jgi:hypothetical protein